MKTLLIVLWTSLFWILFAYVMNAYFPQLLNKPQPELSLISISEETQEFYKSKYVTVQAGKSQGSGCEIKKGYYLTALHLLMSAVVDGETIAVNGQKATLVAKSKLNEDYAIVSTHEQIDKRNAVLPEYQFKAGEDFIAVGSPGEEIALVEPGKIINVTVKDENNKPLDFARKIYSVYIQHGLSGGCVYPIGSDTPVGVVTKLYEGTDSRVGQISLASKPIE